MGIRGFYSGSFDPLTNGHMDIIHQALSLVDHLVIGIGMHPEKKGLFSFEERKEMIETSINQVNISWIDKISVVAFEGLVVDAAKDHDTAAIFRGLRDGTDFNYEIQMAGMNDSMEPSVQTVFLPAKPQSRFITATLVRQIATMKGAVSHFVPNHVLKALNDKFQ